MSGEDFPDVEAGMRAYLRADADVQAEVSQRVFFGVPKKSPVFPLIVVARSGGGDTPGEAPVDYSALTISCWGSTSKEQAARVANAVRRALSKIRGKTYLAPGVYAHGASVSNLIWLPDPEDDRPRYIVTTMVTATAA